MPAPPAPGIIGPRLPSLASLPNSAPCAAKTGLGRSGLIPGARLSPLSREGCVGTGQVLRQNRVQTRPRSSPPVAKPRTTLPQPTRPRPKASEPWQMRDSWEAGGRRPRAVGAGLPVRSLLPGAASRPGPLPTARWGLGARISRIPGPPRGLPRKNAREDPKKPFCGGVTSHLPGVLQLLGWSLGSGGPKETERKTRRKIGSLAGAWGSSGRVTSSGWRVAVGGAFACAL